MNANESEFDRHLATLCAAYNVPCTPERREAYSRAFAKLAPASWARIVEYCVGEEGPARMPTVGQLWEVKRGLRAPGASTRQEPPQDSLKFGGDVWDREANRKLYRYIATKLSANPWHFGEIVPCSGAGVTCHSGEQERATRVLVAYKAAWARDMREAAVNGEVEAEFQSRCWSDCMARAESEIAKLGIRRERPTGVADPLARVATESSRSIIARSAASSIACLTIVGGVIGWVALR